MFRPLMILILIVISCTSPKEYFFSFFRTTPNFLLCVKIVLRHSLMGLSACAKVNSLMMPRKENISPVSIAFDNLTNFCRRLKNKILIKNSCLNLHQNFFQFYDSVNRLLILRENLLLIIVLLIQNQLVWMVNC